MEKNGDCVKIHPNKMRPHIIVIGGGFAGLTAAVALTQRGKKVTLLERRNALGGRARSFYYDSGEVDNGQHVFLGCYRNTLQFLKTIGAEENLFFQEPLHLRFRQRGGIESSLKCPRLPSPWHLLIGLWNFQRLRFRDKWNVWRVVGAGFKPAPTRDARRPAPGSLTVTEWLIQLGQSPLARASLWDPLVIAALNESPDRASASSFLKVLREAFASPDDGRIGLATGGLSQLYAEPAYRWLREHGARVQLNTNVEAIECRGNEVTELALTNGERLTAPFYVSAIPPRDLLSILPERMIQSDHALQNLHSLKASPILSMNLWLDRPLFQEPFVGLLGTKVQWVFNKTPLGARSWKLGAKALPTTPSSQLLAPSFFYSCIISAAYDFLDHTNESLVDIALKELRDCFPEAREFNLVKSQVIREPHATL
ncbi:MAG: FAD-dependent oxidoreductase, partial [Candidatus Omnitrophica bacterium]|nr:FAD-dependent oxidoreductase [Candidatus Omnitrophota bacterium]